MEVSGGRPNAPSSLLRRQNPACLLDSSLSSRHIVAARIMIPFRTISNPAPRTDKAVSFHAVCVVDVNTAKASHLTDGNLVHSDPVVIIQNLFFKFQTLPGCN